MRKILLFLVLELVLFAGNEIQAKVNDSYDEQVKLFAKVIGFYEKKDWENAKSNIEKINHPMFHTPNYFYFYKSEIFLRWALLQKKYFLKRQYLVLSNDTLKIIGEGLDILSFRKKIISLKTEILESIIASSVKEKDHFYTIKYAEELSFWRDLKDQEIIDYVDAMISKNLLTKGRQVMRHYQRTFSRYTSKLPLRVKKLYESVLQEELKSITLPETTPTGISEDAISFFYYDKNLQKILNAKKIEKDQVDSMIELLGKIYYSDNSQKWQNRVFQKYMNLAALQNLSDEERYFVDKVEANLDLFQPSLELNVLNFYWNRYDFKKAEMFGNSILRSYPKDENIPKTLYYLGRVAQDAKEYKHSADYFQKLIEQGLGSKFYDFAWFQKGWSLYLNNENDKAIKVWAQYTKLFPNGEHAQASRYFAIKSLKKIKGNESDIKKWEKELLDNGPIEFYSVLYLYNNGKEYPYRNIFKASKKSENYFKDQIRTSVKNQGKLNRVEELVKLGLYRDAKGVLDSIPLTTENLNFLITYSSLLKDDGIPLQAIYHTRFIYESGIIPDVTSLRWVFPLRWFSDIKIILKRLNWNISPYLVISLIRQESVFDLKALSGSNAKGPMQLIDSTATSMANNLNLKSFDLFELKDNLLLGISNLKAEWEKFDKNIYLALAAYNAGPIATGRWQKIRGDFSPLEFIESIPYKETRTYVKTILRNYFFYQMIYENKSLKDAEVLIQDLK